MNNNITNFENYLNKINSNQNSLESKNQTELYKVYEGFIRGNMFPSLYNQYNKISAYEIKPMNEQAKLLTYIDALSFASNDIKLYLDNFSYNKELIQLHSNYSCELDRVTAEYENNYGPLYSNSPTTNTYPWNWIESPWPWEN